MNGKVLADVAYIKQPLFIVKLTCQVDSFNPI